MRKIGIKNVGQLVGHFRRKISGMSGEFLGQLVERCKKASALQRAATLDLTLERWLNDYCTPPCDELFACTVQNLIFIN